MNSYRFNFRMSEDDSFDFAPHTHVDSAFNVMINHATTLGTVDEIGSASAILALNGIGNVVIGDTIADASVSVRGGNGLTTIVLGNGDDHVVLNGALNTIVLGDGNDVVNAGLGTASAALRCGEVHITYRDYLSATLAAPLGVGGFDPTYGNPHNNIGFFNSGSGNIGVFNGWGNSASTDGNDNIGVFNGNFNGGTTNGNFNIGAFNGNFNGLGNASPSDGNNNGNGNVGVLNGNFNGNLNAGHDAGNDNGNGNVGVDNGNLNGNGAAPLAWSYASHATASLVGGFDTIVVGNGSDSITALAGVSTIVAGNGNDRILIGGSYNTVFAGNGADHVIGWGVDHTSVVLGNGGCTINLAGTGCNLVKTGSGNDIISLSGTGNWVDAGAANTFNTIFGGAGNDTFVLKPAGGGFDKIYNFDLHTGDRLDLRDVMAGTNWDGKIDELSHFLKTETVGGNTFLETTAGPDHSGLIAELMGTSYSLAMLTTHHSLIL